MGHLISLLPLSVWVQRPYLRPCEFTLGKAALACRRLYTQCYLLSSSTAPPPLQGSWSNNGYPDQEWETFSHLSSFWLICSWCSSSTHNRKPLSFTFNQGLIIKFVPADIRSKTVFILRNSVACHIVLKRPSVCVLKDETWNHYSLISFQGSGLHLAHLFIAVLAFHPIIVSCSVILWLWCFIFSFLVWESVFFLLNFGGLMIIKDQH